MNKTVKPFFARFLETEENPDLRAQSALKAGTESGGGGTTPTYPPTKKYPSDGEDSGNSGFLDYDWTK